MGVSCGVAKSDELKIVGSKHVDENRIEELIYEAAIDFENFSRVFDEFRGNEKSRIDLLIAMYKVWVDFERIEEEIHR